MSATSDVEKPENEPQLLTAMRAEINNLKTRVADLERHAFGESKERNGVANKRSSAANKRGDTKTTSPPKPAAAAATATKASAASPTKAVAAATASTALANQDDDDNDADDDDKQAAKKSSTSCPAHAHCSGPLSSTAPSAMESHVRSLPHNIGTSKRQIVPFDDRQGGVLFSGKSCGCSKSKPHYFSVELVGAAPVHEIANCLKCGLQVQLSGQPLLDLRDTAVGTKIKIGQVPQPVAVETAPVALAVHAAPQVSAAPLSPLPHNAPPTNGDGVFDAFLSSDLFAASSPESSPNQPQFCPECSTTDCEHHDEYGNLIRGQKRAFYEMGDFTLALRSALDRPGQCYLRWDGSELVAVAEFPTDLKQLLVADVARAHRWMPHIAHLGEQKIGVDAIPVAMHGLVDKFVVGRGVGEVLRDGVVDVAALALQLSSGALALCVGRGDSWYELRRRENVGDRVQLKVDFQLCGARVFDESSKTMLLANGVSEPLGLHGHKCKLPHSPPKPADVGEGDVLLELLCKVREWQEVRVAEERTDGASDSDSDSDSDSEGERKLDDLRREVERFKEEARVAIAAVTARAAKTGAPESVPVAPAPAMTTSSMAIASSTSAPSATISIPVSAENENEQLHKKAEQGDAKAMARLGKRHYHGENWATAVEWFRKAAALGDAAAVCRLGECYLDGMGVEKDEATAVDWFRKAADLGGAKGMAGLGECYLNGKGVEKNAETGVEWFRKAADLNNGWMKFWLWK